MHRNVVVTRVRGRRLYVGHAGVHVRVDIVGCGVGVMMGGVLGRGGVMGPVGRWVILLSVAGTSRHGGSRGHGGLGREDDVREYPVLVDDLLDHVARRHLHGHGHGGAVGGDHPDSGWPLDVLDLVSQPDRERLSGVDVHVHHVLRVRRRRRRMPLGPPPPPRCGRAVVVVIVGGDPERREAWAGG